MHPSRAWVALRQQPGHLTLKQIVRQILLGLSALHSRSVTHRDLKPANVIVRGCHSAGSGSSSRQSSSAGHGGGSGTGDECGMEVVTRSSSSSSSSSYAAAAAAAAEEHHALALMLTGSGDSAQQQQQGSAADAHSGGSSGSGGGSASSSSASSGTAHVRLADFGSAVDDEVLQRTLGLYPDGPSLEEETAGYQPPETTLGEKPFEPLRRLSYDLWSVGIVILELLLGTPHVIQLSSRAEAALRLRFAGEPPSVLRRLLLANALAEHCILPPADGVEAQVEETRKQQQQAQKQKGPQADEVAASASSMAALSVRSSSSSPSPSSSSSSAHDARRKCGQAQFIAGITRSDPFARVAGVSPLDPSLLDLAWRLLKWDPAERISAAEALESHPAMQRPPPSAAGGGGAAAHTRANQSSRSRSLALALWQNVFPAGEEAHA